MTSAVYVLRSDPDSLSKVGISDQPFVRLSALRTQFKDRKLEIAFAAMCDSREIALRIEHTAQGILWKNRQRVASDWFVVPCTEATTAVLRAAEELGFSLRQISGYKRFRSRESGFPVLVRLQPKQLEALDSWRRKQPDVPSRAEALRRKAGLACANQ